MTTEEAKPSFDLEKDTHQAAFKTGYLVAKTAFQMEAAWLMGGKRRGTTLGEIPWPRIERSVRATTECKQSREQISARLELFKNEWNQLVGSEDNHTAFDQIRVGDGISISTLNDGELDEILRDCVSLPRQMAFQIESFCLAHANEQLQPAFELGALLGLAEWPHPATRYLRPKGECDDWLVARFAILEKREVPQIERDELHFRLRSRCDELGLERESVFRLRGLVEDGDVAPYLETTLEGLLVRRSGFGLVELKSRQNALLLDYFLRRRESFIAPEELANNWEALGGNANFPERSAITSQLAKLNNSISALDLRIVSRRGYGRRLISECQE